MTREEKMWEAVEQEHGGLCRREALVTLTAMEWADKTMIEKACKWIQKEVLEDYEGIIWSDIVKDFRKAMEE